MTPAVTGVKAVPTNFRPVANAAAANYVPTAVTWPAAASQTVEIGPARSGSAGPISVHPVGGKSTGYAGPAKVDVQIVDHAAMAAAGLDGVVVSVAAGSAGAGQVQVTLDYKGFAEAYGGNYGSRLRLVRLPACALLTPNLPQCRDASPLESRNDSTAKTVSATIPVSGVAYSPASGSASETRLEAQPIVLATQSDPGGQGGSGGSYAATELSPSGTWAASGSTGSFRYTYPVSAPAATTKPAPGLGLGYDSGSIDGQTASTQAQASWAGNGWGTQRSYIEQSFVSCEDDPQGTPSPVKTTDLCYNGPILTLSLNGSSTPLVWDATKSVWKPQVDNGEVVKHITNSGNGSGTYNTDYWTVTTRDGTVYSFGRNQLPGWTSGNPRTNSVDHVPVYSPHSGGPCYQISGSGFANSVCRMAYRWSLDYVVDVHGGAMAYYYKQDTNYYGRNKGAVDDHYVRDSYLDHIDYGFTDGAAFGTVPNKVLYGTGPRCVTEPCTPLNASTKANWPDVPYDLICASGTDCNVWGPGFFSTVRLQTITTQQWSVANGRYDNVDTYTLGHTMPATGDGTSPTLWLASITRKGHAGTGAEITLPPVQFGSVKLPNRVDGTADGLPAMQKHRIETITTETGSIVTVGYGKPEPCTAPVNLTPATNTKSCFPMRWTPAGYPDPITDWFHKYAVMWVTATDPTGGSVPLNTSFRYLGGAAWHFDDNELVKAKYRTYGQFRGYGKVQTLTGDGVNDPQTLSEVTYYRGMSEDNSTTVVNVTDSLGGGHEDHDQLAGYELERTEYQGDGGPVTGSTINHYWVSGATATRARSGLASLTATTIGKTQSLTRVALTATGTTTWRYTQTDSTFDSNLNSPTFGLLLRSYNHTVPADPAFDFCSSVTYAPPNTAKNIVGLVSEAETVAAKCGGFTQGTPISVPATVNSLTAPTASRPAQVVSAERTFYDDPSWSTAFPQTSAPGKGLVTMTRRATDYTGGAYVWQTLSRATYDGYGRVLDSYDANGNKTVNAYTMNAAGLTTGASVKNALEQSTSSTLDTRRGAVLSVTDPNGILAQTEYDTLGRKAKVWLHSRPTTAAANYKFTYNIVNNGVTYIKAEKLNESLGYQTSITLFDALLRVRQTQAITPQSGRLVADKFYDSRGWTKATYNGWWDSTSLPNGTIVTATDLGAQVPSQDFLTYDGLGREVTNVKAKNGQAVSTTTTVHNGDRTTVIAPEGSAVMTAISDPLGRIKERIEYTVRPTVNTPANTFTGIFTISGGTPISTTYGFDARGNQDVITNKAGTTWRRTYDLLGRMTSITDPDAGDTTGIKYDANGNFVESTDERGKTTSYTYDKLNRKTGHYASAVTGQVAFGQTGANQLAKWVYDNSDNAVPGMTNPIGKQTGSTAYWNQAAYTKQQKGFDVFGNSLGVTVTIPSSTEGSVLGSSYTLTRTYSPNTGLLLQDKYPLKWGLPLETVNHGYGGVLDLPATLGGLAGYAANTTYDAYGRVNQGTLGASPNTASITYTYDPHTGTLKNRLVTRSLTTPYNVDEQAYVHDLSGNIRTQASTRLGAASPTETQCFRYDELIRLVAAWTATDACAVTPTTGNRSMVGSGAGASSRYWTTWVIDDLGNRTEQKQWGTSVAGDTTTSYTYDGNGAGQPHTLTSTTSTGAAPASTGYTYDPSGNMNGRNAGQGNQVLHWDDAGRLTSITGGTAGTSNFIYDADGELLLQKDQGQTILYLPGQQITLNTSTNTATGVRYYPLPGGGTAVRTGSGTNYKFVISDHHGTGELLLDNTAQNPTWRQFTAYGAPRGTGVSWPDNRAFLGKPANPGTGLTVVGARSYDPMIGRFISVDPEIQPSKPQSLSAYLYANNNPITFSDPTGRDWWDDLKNWWNESSERLNNSEYIGTCFGGDWCAATELAVKHNDYSGFHPMLTLWSVIPLVGDPITMLQAEVYEIEGNQAAADELRNAVAANNSMPAGDFWAPAGVIVLSKRLFAWGSKKKPGTAALVQEWEVKVTHAPKFEEGKVDRGVTALSRVAQQYREQIKTDAGQNVAVFLVHEGGDKYKFVVAPNIGHGGEDSERILDDFIAQRGIKPEQVKAVYSERIPCGPERQNCNLLLQTKFPQAKVTYTYTWAESNKARQEIYQWQQTQRDLRMGRL